MALGAYQSEYSRGNVLNAIAHPNVVNPVAAMTQGWQAYNALAGVQQNQANQAIGQAYQGAIDPNTGEFDPNKFRTLAAANPMTARAIGAGLENVQQISSDQLKQNLKKYDAYHGEAANLADSPTYGTGLAGIARLMDAGIMTPVEAQRTAVQLLNTPQDQLANLGKQHMVASADARTRIDTLLGTRVGVTGPSGTTLTTQPGVGKGDVFIPSQPSPEWWGQQVPGGVVDPRKALPDGTPNPDYGRKMPMTNQEYWQKTGNMPPGAPGGTQPPPIVRSDGGGGGGGGNAALPTTGRYNTVPPALRGPNAPAAGGGGGGNANLPGSPPVPPVSQPTAATPAAVPFGGYSITPPGATSTAPSPAVVQPPATAPATSPVSPPAAAPQRVVSGLSPAEEATSTASGAQFTAETTRGADAQSRIATLENLRTDLAQFTPGAGSDLTKHLGNMIASWAPGTAQAMGITDPTAAREAFDKGIAQIVQAQNARSDKDMSVGIASTPTSGLTKAGADLILRQLQGNEDYIRARSALANQYPNKNDYSGFNDAVKQLDPRVFQYDRMEPSQKHTWFDALTEPQKAAFVSAYRWAQRPGLSWAGNQNLIPSERTANAAGG